MSASNFQALLRFLSQDAKVPLAAAMGKVKELQKANLDTPEKIAKVKADEVKLVFEDEKLAKQVLAAAKRVSKKRAAGDDDASQSPAKKKKTKGEVNLDDPELSPADLEASLSMPSCSDLETDLGDTTIFSNRAPLALAFVFTLLKFTMPGQPLSSRLSLAQGYIGITSKARALALGIDKGRSAEEEGFGTGQPGVMVAGKDVKVLRRWGYEWKADEEASVEEGREGLEEEPPLWALDLEALRKSNTLEDVPAIGRTAVGAGGGTNLPIHTPQAARAYLMKAFAGEQSEHGKRGSAATVAAEKEKNLGKLLRTLELLYESWAAVLSPEDLDKRTWGWYVRVRPDVADGAAGCELPFPSAG